MARRRKDWDEALTVRLAADEAARVRSMAESRQISYSDLIREAVKAYTEPAPPLTNRLITQDYNVGAQPAVDSPKPQLDASLKEHQPKVLTTSWATTT